MLTMSVSPRCERLQMKKEIRNVPERIFLVLGDGIFDGSEDFDELSEVTWSKERVYPNDIEFVRKK